jgi:Putative polyhydroxyalkanoic acid system protein (PHA_gran_rgn)
MSVPLVVSIPHYLGKEEALRRLKNGLAEVGTSFRHLFSVREQIWTGDHLRFEVSALGQSASGSIDVAEDYVRLEVFLPWLLAKLVGTIQPLLRKEATSLLERKK